MFGPRRLPYLVTAQVLGGIGVASGIAVGGLLAEQVSGSASLAGLAQTSSVLCGAVLAVPLAQAAERLGRAVSLSTGYLIALTGAAVVILGALIDRFSLLLVGMGLFGAATASGLQARYAAIDNVDVLHRGRVLSIVVWATTVGSVLAPNLSGVGGRLGVTLGLPALAGPFLFSLAAFALAATATWRLPGGRQPLGHHASPVRTRAAMDAVRSHPGALAALVAMAGAHTAMVAVMVMTPVHLGHGGATLQIIGLVISVHIAGMYALSPVMGWCTDRFGPHRTILGGVILLLGALQLTSVAADHQRGQIGVGLTLLGLGWSACTVAGSSLLTSSVPVALRPRTQGVGDLAMGMSAATAGVIAGPVLDHLGYGALSLGATGLLVPMTALVLRAMLDQRRGHLPMSEPGSGPRPSTEAPPTEPPTEAADRRLTGMAVESTMVPLGTQLPSFALTALDGEKVSSADLAGRPVLVAFVCNHCPYVKHVEQRFGQVVAAHPDLQVVAICTNDADAYPDDRPEQLAEQARRAGWTFPYLVDDTQDVGRAFRAACTPDFFLYDSGGRLAYRGAMDGSTPGNGVPVTGDLLDAAIGRVLAGEPVPEPHRPSMGCSIKWRG